MGKLSDIQIRNWIKVGERFDSRGDGDGLYLRFSRVDAAPLWRFRYRFDGKARIMNIGSYTVLSLADARKTVKELRARVALGHDVAAEKQDRKKTALAKIEEEKNSLTVGELADQYFERMIVGHWKHPNIVRSRIERDIKPNIGKLAVKDVKPTHIDAMLQSIVKRGAPTTANDVLRWVIFHDDPRVMLCSTFQHPFYPSSGADSGNDHIINVPLPARTGSEEFRAAITQHWFPALERFNPELLLISAGFDAHRDDKMAGLNLTEDDYAWITKELKRFAGGRIVSVLEGGYELGALGRSAVAHIRELTR